MGGVILGHIGGFLFGFVLGVIADRLIVTVWLDQISRLKMRLLMQTVVGVTLVMTFFVSTIYSIVNTDFHVDKEFYWVIIIISASLFGLESFKDANIKYPLENLSNVFAKNKKN